MSTKEYYQKNKDKWKVYHQTIMCDPEKHKQKNEKIKQWKKNNPEKVKLQRKKDNHNYYHSHINEPEFHRKMLESSRKYFRNNRDKHNQSVARYCAKPEIKKKRAEYNRQYHKNHPDKLLRNIKTHLTKIGFFNNLEWWQVVDQLKGWSKIIHEDHNQKCAVCGNDSTQAHHILHKSKYPQLVFNRNNGIALCDKCHYEVHGKTLILRGI